MSKEMKALEIIKAEIIAKNGEDYSLEDDEKLNESLRTLEIALIKFEDCKAIIRGRNQPKLLADSIEKKLKALEILSEHIIINEKNGYVEFQCDFSLPTNSKYESEEHFKEKIKLLKEVLL